MLKTFFLGAKHLWEEMPSNDPFGYGPVIHHKNWCWNSNGSLLGGLKGEKSGNGAPDGQ